MLFHLRKKRAIKRFTDRAPLLLEEAFGKKDHYTIAQLLEVFESDKLLKDFIEYGFCLFFTKTEFEKVFPKETGIEFHLLCDELTKLGFAGGMPKEGSTIVKDIGYDMTSRTYHQKKSGRGISSPDFF